MPSCACYYSSSAIQYLSNTDNDFPSLPPSLPRSLIRRRRRWFPATIIKMNHSKRDSGGGQEQREGSAGYLSQEYIESTQRETIRRSFVRRTFIVLCSLHIMQVSSVSSYYTTTVLQCNRKPNVSIIYRDRLKGGP